MIIDIHGHLGNINIAPFWQADAAKLEEYCEKSGVDTLCVSSSRSLMYDIREGNAELDAALQETDETALATWWSARLFPNRSAIWNC